MTKPIELTIEDIEQQITRAMSCERMTLPGDQFRAIFDLATRVKSFDVSYLDHLNEALARDEVKLTGREIRSLLSLALQAKRAGLPPRPRNVK